MKGWIYLVSLLLLGMAALGLLALSFQQRQALEALTFQQREALEAGLKKLNLPVKAEEVVEIAARDPAVVRFIAENFRDPSMRLEQVSLVKQEGSYVWQVRLMERVCGCQGAATLSVAEVVVDPEGGAVLGRQFREGVAESILAREQCGKGCHEKGRSAP